MALLASLVPLGVSASAQTAPGPFQEVGTLPRMPADAFATFGNKITTGTDFTKEAVAGVLLGIPESRELWQFWITSSPAAAETSIAIRNMDTLKIVGTLTLPYELKRGTQPIPSGEYLHAFDGGRRVFFLDSARTVIIEIDLKTKAVKTTPVGLPWAPAGRGITANTGIVPGTFAYDPFGDAIIILFAGPSSTSSANTNVDLHRVDLKTTAVSTRLLTTCNGPLPSSESSKLYQSPALVTQDFVYFTCQRAGSVGAVIRVSRQNLMTPGTAEEFVIGPAYLETALIDRVAGRIFMITLAGEIWAFDVKTMAFIGVVAAGREGSSEAMNGYGLDPVTGRLFFTSHTYGLGVVEGRFFPIPQARIAANRKAPGQEAIVSDAKTNRFFVLFGRGATDRAKSYTIFQTDAAPVPPPAPDPDRNTSDRKEEPGVTDRRYFASGTGYGVRALMAKGLVTVVPAPTMGQNAYTAQVINRNINSTCGYTDRELVAGRVSKAEYDTGSTAARAVAVDVDERTKLDLAHLSRCDVKAKNGSEVFAGVFSTGPPEARKITAENEPGREWTRQGATCSSSEGYSDGTEAVEDESEVTCPDPGKKLVAEATSRLDGGVAVGKAYTTTEIELPKNGGVSSKVVSVAQDVTIGDATAITIGEIRSETKSTSNGRPSSKPLSEHKVTVKSVTLETQELCKDRCDLATIVPVLNRAMSGRAEFRTVSGVDDSLKQGTPRGALTAVQKSVARQASDMALIGDFSTEVPALELIVYNDNTEFGRARQIYQFAGVASAATYNIVPVPPSFDFDPDGPDGGDFSEDAFSPEGLEGSDILPGVTDLPENVSASSSSEGGGGIMSRVLRALGRGVRLFWSNPRQALLLLTAWALFSLPPVLSRRRRLLAAVRTD